MPEKSSLMRHYLVHLLSLFTLLSTASVVHADLPSSETRFAASGYFPKADIHTPILFQYSQFIYKKSQSDTAVQGTTGEDSVLAVAERLLYNNQSDSALHILENAIGATRNKADTPSLAKLALLLGSAYYNNTSYQRAIDAWKTSLLLYDSLLDTLGYAKAASNLGAAYLEIGYNRSAYDLFKESLYILPPDRRSDEPGQIALVNMAVSQIAIGMVDEAQVTLEQIMKRPASNHVELLCHINLGKIALAQDNIEALNRHVTTARAFINEYPYYSSLLQELEIEQYIMEGHLQEARRLLEMAWDKAITIGAVDRSLFSLINDYELQGGQPFLTDSLVLEQMYYSSMAQDEPAVAESYALHQIGKRRLAANGDYESAYKLSIKADSLYDALIDSQQVILAYDFKEQQTNILKSEKILLLTKELEVRKKLLSFAIGAIIVLLIMLITIARYHAKLKSAHRSLYDKNKEWAETFITLVQPTSSNTGDHAATNEDAERVLWNEVLYQFNQNKIYQNPELKLDDLVRVCETNKTYLYNAIKRFSGKTFVELVNMYRVEAAKQLLLEGSANTWAIVEAAGFNSKSSFYRVFKSITGMTPGEFVAASR